MTRVRIGFCMVLFATVAFAAPASAWWQFVSLGPDGLREVHSPFKTEASCQAALKKVEAQMKKQFPHQYPLVGSCEEYENKK
jgi:hypothetical protein